MARTKASERKKMDQRRKAAVRKRTARTGATHIPMAHFKWFTGEVADEVHLYDVLGPMPRRQFSSLRQTVEETGEEYIAFAGKTWRIVSAGITQCPYTGDIDVWLDEQ